MYHFSRSIYKQLAPVVLEDAADPTGCRNKQIVLDACETTIRRLATDRRYFARPAKKLFDEVRVHFPLGEQLRAWMVIETNVRLAQEFLDRTPEVDMDGVVRECRAHTRKGSQCQRDPLPGRDYCPSHKHLEETFSGSQNPADELAANERIAPTAIVG